MALTATVYNLDIDLADIDRGVYTEFALLIPRHPSETLEYMLIRVLAYCLEYTDGIELTQGVASGDEPAILIRDLTGRIVAWIEVGMPDPDRLHRGRKRAGRAAVYTHRDARKLLAQFGSANVYRLHDIPIYAFDRSFVEAVASRMERRSHLSLSITERELYLQIGGQSFSTTIAEHRGPRPEGV